MEGRDGKCVRGMNDSNNNDGRDAEGTRWSDYQVNSDIQMSKTQGDPWGNSAPRV